MLLTLALVLTFMPASAFAEGEAENPGENEAAEVAVQTEPAEVSADEGADDAQPAEEKAAAQTPETAADAADDADDEGEDEEPVLTECVYDTDYDYKGYIGSQQLVGWFGHDGEQIRLKYSDGSFALYLYDQDFEWFYLDEENSTYPDAEYNIDPLTFYFDFADPDVTAFAEGVNYIMVKIGDMTAKDLLPVTGQEKAPAVRSLKYTQKAGNDPLEAYAGVKDANWLNCNWPQSGDTLVVGLDNGTSVKYTYTDGGDDDEDSGFKDPDGNDLEDTYTESFWLEFKDGQNAYAVGANTVSFCMLDDPSYSAVDDGEHDDYVVRCDINVKGVTSNVWSISYKKTQQINLEQEEGYEEYFDDYDQFSQGDVLTIRYLDGSSDSYTFYEDESAFINKHGKADEEYWDYPEDDPECYDTQDESPWVKGYYSLFYSYQGVSCEVTNAVYVKQVPHVHSILYYPGEEPDCSSGSKGVREHYFCEICDKCFEDEDGMEEVPESELEIRPSHEWGEWDDWNTAASPKYRMRFCEICGEEDYEYGAHEHSLFLDEGEPASCSEEGIKEHYTCEICGKAFADEAGTKELSDEELEIPLQKHSYSEPEYKWSSDNREVIATAVCTECDEEVEETVRTRASIKKKATCVSKGITAYTASFKSEAFSTQTKELENRVIDPYAHSWDAGRVTLKANASRTGKKEYKCTACGKTRTEIIPKVTLAKTTIRNTVANSAKKTNDVIWDKVPGATGYEICWRARGASNWAKKEVGNVSRGATTGLTIGGLYEIKVRPIKAASAANDKSYGPYSDTVYRYFFTTQKIRLTSNSKGTFTMSWARDSRATGYQVLYTTNKNGAGAAQNIKSAGATATSITVRDIKVNGKVQKLKSGTTYYVQVREIRKVGSTNYIGNISCPVAVRVK